MPRYAHTLFFFFLNSIFFLLESRGLGFRANHPGLLPAAAAIVAIHLHAFNKILFRIYVLFAHV